MSTSANTMTNDISPLVSICLHKQMTNDISQHVNICHNNLMTNDISSHVSICKHKKWQHILTCQHLPTKWQMISPQMLISANTNDRWHIPTCHHLPVQVNDNWHPPPPMSATASTTRWQITSPNMSVSVHTNKGQMMYSHMSTSINTTQWHLLSLHVSICHATKQHLCTCKHLHSWMISAHTLASPAKVTEWSPFKCRHLQTQVNNKWCISTYQHLPKYKDTRKYICHWH